MIGSAVLVLAGQVMYAANRSELLGPILTVVALIVCTIEFVRSYVGRD